jgi:pyruvate/2-oxoglutarate dehydrogenase complex dihydrolipoamide dehydrogenase (E3) component
VSARYDLVVLGGGTGGLVSSMIAAGVGARVALVERARTGGDCLWTGCVPSKSLIAAASLAHRMRHADAVGLARLEPQIDLARVMDHVQDAIRTIEPQDSPERLRAAGVEVIEAEGRFVARGTIEAGGRELSYRAAIIATGSEPRLPPIAGLEDSQPLTTETVWQLRKLPARLVVLGGGPVGCELAQAFGRLGARVTLVEMADRLLLKEEPRASQLIATRLRSEGIDVRLGARANALRESEDGTGRELVLDEPTRESIPFDRILLATGRAPRTKQLGLEMVGVQTDGDGAVVVDSRLRTTAPSIFAAGDVTGLLPFTHVAAHHARVATPNALFHARATVEATIPWATFTDPEVARVGLTEQQARERWGERVSVAEFDYANLDRAITAGEAYGFAKLVAAPRRRLVGATLAAPAAGEAIAELTAWVSRRATLDTVSQTVHAYPTLAEGPARAADAQLAARYSSPSVRAIARPLLAVMRAIERTSRRR